MVFVFQKVFANTIFYQILVFGDTNISIKIIHVSVPPGRNCRTYRFACLLPHRACCNRQRHIRRLHIVHPRAPEGVQRLFFLVKIIDKLFHLCTEGVEGAPVTLNGENAVMENFFVVIVFITGVLDG